MNITKKKMAFLGDSITAGGIVSDQKTSIGSSLNNMMIAQLWDMEKAPQE
ncbi:MAG: hypothetical protein IKV73_00110 [Clostridia bacterium]|nr:hypothetical protein [Clostridia bacterium]